LSPILKKSFYKLVSRFRLFLAIIATAASWLVISPSLDRRSGIGLDFTDVSTEVMLSLEDTPHRYEFLSKEEAHGLCPGLRCPLNHDVPAGALTRERKITANMSTITTTDGWRNVMYLRWDTLVPRFVKNEGQKVAFDFYGIRGESWSFFVNGKLISRGLGGTDLPAVVFDAPSSANSPMTLGFEVDVGRSLAPGVAHIAQIFLSRPEAAGKFRQAYRALDRMSVLPSAAGFAMVAMLAGLGCFFTPFFNELLAFSIFVTTFNLRLLMVNDMVSFPAWLKVDFVTTDALLRCILLGTMWAFWGLYFRAKSRLKWVPVALYAALAAVWYCVGLTGFGAAALVWFSKSIDIHQVLVFAGASVLGLRTWQAARKMPEAKFRTATSFTISICALLICASFIAKIIVTSGGSTWQGYRTYEPLYFFANYSVRAFIIGFGLIIALEWSHHVRTKILVQTELKLAQTVQRKFLPDDSYISDRVSIFGLFKPATACSGDWWSHLHIKNDRHIAMIGDVTGHGVPAALLAASMNSSSDLLWQLHRRGALASLTAADIVGHLNASVCSVMKSELFCSLSLVDLDLSRRKLAYACAGHIPPVIIRDDARAAGALEVMTSKSRNNPLGVNDAEDFEVAEIDLVPGDRIVMYSDGLTEWFSHDGKRFKSSELRKYLLSSHHVPAQNLCEDLVNMARALSKGSAQSDDITVVIIDYKSH